MKEKRAPKNRWRKEKKGSKEKSGNLFVRFLRWIFPWKGDTGKTVSLKIVFLICLVTCIISGVVLADSYIKDQQADHEYLHAQSLMGNSSAEKPTEDPEEEDKPKLPLPEGYREEYDALYQINQQLCGWVKIEGTGIDYPVVHPDDNSYYLNHTFYGSYNSSGVPYLDYRCRSAGGALSTNSIIYGHNLNSGRMFHDIVHYKDVSYYKSHPVIEFNTVYADSSWKIIGMFFANADMSLEDAFPYHMFLEKETDEQFYDVLNNAMQRSFFTTGVDVNADDKLLMLSTCDNAFGDSRLVLLARQVRSGESAAVDTSSAKQNASQYLPQNYIDKFGGEYREWDKDYRFYS